MTSSGIKRGVAAAAISALAVAGLPLFAGTASATTIATEVGGANVELYAPQSSGISAKDDGTNTSVSLVAGGGTTVTSVLFQYRTTAGGATWLNVPGGNVARNADGVFKADWTAPPADTIEVRAVAGPGGATDAATVVVPLNAAANTVELASEGALGVFQEPYTTGPYSATTSELLAVTGTVSQGSGAPTVTDASHGTGASDAGTLETTPSTTSDDFNAVVDIDGYPYSAGTDANQIALNAATSNTDDAEGSTLYIQTIGSITADPGNQNDATPADASVTLTVLDTLGNPVAGAEVFSGGDTDTDGAGPDADTDGAETLVGYTDGRGQIEVTPAVANGSATPNGGTETYYVNKTDDDTRNAGDPTVDVTVNTAAAVVTTVDIVNERNRTNFDQDELSDGDDFTVETLDQFGNPYDEDGNSAEGDPSDVEYLWTFDPAGPAPAAALGVYTDADDQGDGTFLVPAPSTLAEGTYSLDARRPNVGGSGLVQATPETNLLADDADVVFEDGAQANAPVNGDTTATGNLSNSNGPLGGREVEMDYHSGGDAGFAPQSEQPAGVTLDDPAGGPFAVAYAVTDANGDFTVALSDPEIPANVEPTEESGDLHQRNVTEAKDDTTSLNAGDDDLIVNWIVEPMVSRIEIGDFEVVDGQFGPGRPMAVEVQVFGEDDDTDPSNDPVLTDYPVDIEVDKGFVTPYADDEDDLDLADGHDAEGDLWGFFENLGTTDGQTTSDDIGGGVDFAGFAVAIERDADFDDNGLTDVTYTVTAGDVTESETLTADVRDPINVATATLPRDAGEPAGAGFAGPGAGPPLRDHRPVREPRRWRVGRRGRRLHGGGLLHGERRRHRAVRLHHLGSEHHRLLAG